MSIMSVFRFLLFTLTFLAVHLLSAQHQTSLFQDYWFGGEAELTRYDLRQSRYGEIHDGDAVLIYVTEPFRMDKQVKYEGGDQRNVSSVLKLNLTRKFFTGIYPYSIMSSIFSPLDPREATVKTSTTSQEWCGHSFSQLNLRSGQYHGVLRSYFQAEGDQEFRLPQAMLEDEIWTKIRLDPTSLPTGQIDIIPGGSYLRLHHESHKVQSAQASFSPETKSPHSDQPVKTYTVAYQHLARTLSITYETRFPFSIVAWEETTSMGPGSRKLTTTAIRTHTMKLDYWNRHNNKDKSLRRDLGLDPASF
ncbi:MAG: hypothetical protein KTR24_14910 [Saprospiraceae bacterium]|nr:hypothetical protein [Saprospiraceae bacterium]